MLSPKNGTKTVLYTVYIQQLSGSQMELPYHLHRLPLLSAKGMVLRGDFLTFNLFLFVIITWFNQFGFC